MRMKKARAAQGRLRRLVGQAGLSPNCCRVQHSVHSGSGTVWTALWWKRDDEVGTKDNAAKIQVLVNQEARVSTGLFRITFQRGIMMESELRTANAKLNNRKRRCVLRLLSPPRGDQARELARADSTLGKALSLSSNIGDGRKRRFCWKRPLTWMPPP